VTHGDDLELFRARVRAWLEEHGHRFAPPVEGEGEGESVARQQAMQASLYDAGLAGLTVPTELGGQGLGVREQFAFNEEIAGYGLENGHLVIGLGMVVPTLIAHGTPEQQARYLRPLLRGEHKWCQFFSEPGAGSDLASLTTRAERDGDEWVVTGQKVWTSGARHARYGILLARTDLDAPKHEGLTMFVCPLDRPGITIRPLRQMTGSTGFNEVFFDGVRIPHDHVLGPVNGGWRVGVTTLMNERTTLGAGRAGSGAAVAARLIDTARAFGLAADPCTRDALADFWIRETIVSYLGQRLRAAVLAGRQPGPEGSLAKLAFGTLAWRAGELGVRFAGMAALAWPGEGPDVPGQPPFGWGRALCQAPAQTIAGGTTEVQKGILGERLLGLPKEPAVDRGVPFRQLAVAGGRHQETRASK
jgi:alkylation response protein AidB-like acyl-CoA dehydrogenase